MNINHIKPTITKNKMKNLNQIFTVSLIVLFTSISFAQKNSLDSLFVEIDQKIVVKMNIYDYSNLKKTVEEDLSELQDILKTNQGVPQNSPYTIAYEPNEKLAIKSEEIKETIIWKNGEHTPYTFNNRCEVLSDKYNMTIDFNDLENLISEYLIPKVMEVLDTTIAKNTRRSRLFKFSFKKDSLVNNENYNIGTTGDVLFLKAGVGANLIKNQPVIDLVGELGFGFTSKDILKNQYYLSYNILYDFVDNSTFNINSFLCLGYRRNFSNSKDDENWIGIDFGYLISQDGDMFDEDTFRFGFNWQAGKYITISPQLYISSEQTYPGLRIGFGF
jgi:hypothetical protein